MKSLISSLSAVCLFLGMYESAVSQGFSDRSEQESQRLVLNADGSLNYYEPFGAANESLLEFKSKPRPTIELLMYLPNEQRKISVIDYNNDGKPDFIHLEHQDADGNTDMVGLYRGPEHKLHEAGHLEHALKHHFIHSDTVAERQLMQRLEAIRLRTIAPDEIGVFSGYGLFAELHLPAIKLAFESADELFVAISHITKMTLNKVDRIPGIAGQHGKALEVLLSTDPHNLGPEVPTRKPTPEPALHPEDE